MAKNYIVKELINEMKDRIPQGQNLANYLTDTLYMGKEAVYRRLRGEVAFTFDEIADEQQDCCQGECHNGVIRNRKDAFHRFKTQIFLLCFAKNTRLVGDSTLDEDIFH